MVEQEFMIVLGNNIRLFRKRIGMTQGQLANKIGRSLASVSKYERGDCSIDSYTLYKIADVLNIAVSQLLPEVKEQVKVEPVMSNWKFISQHNVFYLHNVGYISQKMCCSVLEIDWDTNSVIMYLDVDGQKKEDYRRDSNMILYGNVICTSACTNIWVNNPVAPIDFFHIVVNSADWTLGKHICYVGYSTMNWRVVASKAVLTLTPEVPEDIEEQLAFSKKELKEIGKKNQVLF
ncbi:MAG: helix-turn-helix transcriptional regulator [Eubacteriales bacterium]|nr:helix-turn-helix transcriptional regulator [Eubacteriales bacterium]